MKWFKHHLAGAVRRSVGRLRQLWASFARRHLVAPDPHPEPVPPWVYESAPPERYRLRVCRACGGTVIAGLAHVCRGSVRVVEDDGAVEGMT